MKINSFLSILLAIQIALLAYQYQDQPEYKDSRKPLYVTLLKADEKQEITTAVDKVNQVEIADFQDKAKVSFQKAKDQWVVSSAFDYPADQSKVNGLIQKVLNLNFKEIIATKSSNHHKLNVAQDQYDKKLSIQYADQKITWYIGNGKSGSINMRREGEEIVYKISQLSAYADLNSNANQYMNTQYFSIKDPVRIEVIKNEPLILEKGEQWQVNGFEQLGKTLDEQKVTAYVNQLKDIYLDGIASKTVSPDHGFDQGMSVKLKSSTEEKSYQIGKEVDQHYYVKASDRDYVVKVSSYKIKNIIDQKILDFAKDEVLPDTQPAVAHPHQPAQ